MIAQHRMIKSARRPRIGSPLRVSLSSFAFQLVRDNRSVPRVLSREEPRRVVPTIARPYVRLKLKTSIEREREEEGAWRDKGEENGGAGIRKKKNKNRKKETKYERMFSASLLGLLYGSPWLPSKKRVYEGGARVCSGSPLRLENTSELLGERPSPAS